MSSLLVSLFGFNQSRWPEIRSCLFPTLACLSLGDFIFTAEKTLATIEESKSQEQLADSSSVQSENNR